MEIGPGMSPTHSDFLPQLKAIGQSLKKRFFRKPNVADAVEQYNVLCQELKRDGQDEFAAVCVVEAAKCYESLQNHIEYANALVKAANYFLEAKESQSPYEPDDSIIHVSTRGKLQLAMQYLDKAARVYKQQQHEGLYLLTTIMMAQTLLQEKEYGESLKYFKRGLESAKSFYSLADQLIIVDAILKCKIKLGDLESSSKLVQEYVVKLKVMDSREEFPPELIKKYISRYELNGVCLLLILGTESADLSKFLWPEGSLPPEDDGKNLEAGAGYEVSICMKSLVIAVEQRSIEDMLLVHLDHLSPILTEVEFQLFSILITLSQ